MPGFLRRPKSFSRRLPTVRDAAFLFPRDTFCNVIPHEVVVVHLHGVVQPVVGFFNFFLRVELLVLSVEFSLSVDILIASPKVGSQLGDDGFELPRNPGN